MVFNISWLNTQQDKVRIKGKGEQSKERSNALLYILMCCIVTTMINYTNICMQNHTERHSLLEKYTSHFIWKGCVWEGLGDRTELQHIDPHSYGHQRFFPVLLCCLTGGLGPASLGAGFLYRILSLTGLVSKLSIEGLRAPSFGSWLSLPHLVSKTNWLPVSPSYIIVQRPLNISP